MVGDDATRLHRSAYGAKSRVIADRHVSLDGEVRRVRPVTTMAPDMGPDRSFNLQNRWHFLRELLSFDGRIGRHYASTRPHKQQQTAWILTLKTCGKTR